MPDIYHLSGHNCVHVAGGVWNKIYPGDSINIDIRPKNFMKNIAQKKGSYCFDLFSIAVD